MTTTTQQAGRNRKTRTGHLYRRGEVYWIKYTVDGKTIRQSLKTTDADKAEQERRRIIAPIGHATKEEAVALLIGKLDEARREDDALPAMKITEAFDSYYNATNRPDSGEGTLDGNRRIYNRFVGWLAVAHPGASEVRQVNDKIAQEYVKNLEADPNVNDSTFNRHVGFLSLMWSVLFSVARCKANPWAWDKKTRAGIQRKAVVAVVNRKKALTAEQAQAAIDAAPGDLADLFTVLTYSAQRLYDCVHLRWTAIDKGMAIIKLVQKKMARRVGTEEVIIPIMPPLKAVLMNRKAGADGDYVFPDLVELYSRDKGSTLCKRIGDIFEQIGLEVRRKVGEGRAVTQYGAQSFRHAFVTIARSYGIPDAIVSRITGHKTTAMLNHYTQITPEIVKAFATKAQGQKLIAAPGADDDVLTKVVKLARGMTAKNWTKRKAEILAAIQGAKLQAG